MKVSEKLSNSIGNEIKRKNFGFDHPDPEDFVKSKWQKGTKSGIYLVYRWILALFYVGLFTVCLALQFCGGKLFIYLTNWGIILCVVTNLVAVIIVTQWHFNIGKLPTIIVHKSFECHTPTLLRYYWLIHGITLQLALVITTIYWAFIYGKQNKPVRFPTLSFVSHTFNSVFMVIDFIAVGFPVRLLHTLYAMMLPIIYCCCTIVYYHLGGVDEYGNHFIYPILDWKKPGLGMLTFAGVFSLYVIYSIILFTLYKFKLVVHKWLQNFLKSHSCDMG